MPDLKIPHEHFEIDASALQQEPPDFDGITFFPFAFTSGAFENGFLVIERQNGGKELGLNSDVDPAFQKARLFFERGGKVLYCQALGTHVFSFLDLADTGATDTIKLTAIQIGTGGNNSKVTVATGTAGRKIITLEYVPPAASLADAIKEEFDVPEDDEQAIIDAINGVDGVNVKSRVYKASLIIATGVALANISSTASAGGATPSLISADFTNGLTAQIEFAPDSGTFKGQPGTILPILSFDTTIHAALATHAQLMLSKNKPVHIFIPVSNAGAAFATLVANIAGMKAVSDALVDEGFMVGIGQDTKLKNQTSGAIELKSAFDRVMFEVGHVASLPYFLSPAVGDFEGDEIDFSDFITDLGFDTQEEDLDAIARVRFSALQKFEGRIFYRDYLTLAKETSVFASIHVGRILGKLLRGLIRIWVTGGASGKSYRNKPNTETLRKEFKEDIVKFLAPFVADEAIILPEGTTLDDLVRIESDRDAQILRRVDLFIGVSPVLEAKNLNGKITLT